jgi:hypothetical protein
VHKPPQLRLRPRAAHEKVGQSRDDVMRARALAAAEDNSDRERGRHDQRRAGGRHDQRRAHGGRGARDELEARLAVRVRQLLLHEPVVRMSWRGAARDDAQRRRRGEGGRQLDGRAPAQLGERTHRVLRRPEPLLESQGHGDGVGEGALVLDRADVRKGRARAPRGAPLGKRAEGRALEFDERLADHRLVLALAPLDGEHGRERHPLCAPLSRRLDEALQARHHPRALLADEGGRGEAEGVAVVRVEGRGPRRHAFVLESSPPMTTSPSKSWSRAVAVALSN